MTDKKNQPVVLDVDGILKAVTRVINDSPIPSKEYTDGLRSLLASIVEGKYSTPVAVPGWIDVEEILERRSAIRKDDTLNWIQMTDKIDDLLRSLLAAVEKAQEYAQLVNEKDMDGEPCFEFLKAQDRRHVVVENRSTGSWDVVDMHERIAVFYTSMQCKNGELEAQAHADKLDGVGQEEKWEKSGRRSSNLYGLFSPDGEEIAEIHEEYIDAVLNALNRGEE